MTKLIIGILVIIFCSQLVLTIPAIQQAKEVDTQVYVVGAEISKINLSKQETPEDTPNRIVIPSVSINMNVVPSEIVDNTWSLSDNYASYGIGSSLLDESHGNPVIFGHARWGMFLSLKDVKVGDKVTIFGSKGYYEYVVEETTKILPEDIEGVISKGGTNLTLFTCDGVGDEYRFLVKAKKIDTVNYLDTKEVI